MMWSALACTLYLGSLDLPDQDDAARANLKVHFSIDQTLHLSAQQLSAAIDQVRMIWKPLAVHVSFGGYGEPAPPGASKISLRMVQHRQFLGERPILAWTSVAPTGVPAPALFVSVPALTDLLSEADVKGRQFSQRPLALRERLVGQAIGRVVAHELGHYLLKSVGHRDRGLMRPAYSPADLIGPWLHPFMIPDDLRDVVRNEMVALAQAQAGSR